MRADPGSLALIDSREPVLETRRLWLRRLTLDDAAFMLSVWNDPAFLQHVGDRGIRNVADAQAALIDGAFALYESYGYGPYCMSLKSDGTAIGICGLFRRDNLEHPDIGFAVLPEFYRLGLTTEAAEAVVDYARDVLGLEYLTAIVSPRNSASIGLLEKLGLTFDRGITMPGEKEEISLYGMRLDQANRSGMEFLKGDGARTGLFFGATSGVITTIGLIVGLNSGTRSITAVLGGILVIAVADAMSDALGIHLAEESDPATSHDHVWAATITTFVTKFVFSISFAVPLLLLPLATAVMVSVAWGMLVIAVLSYFLARTQNESPWAIIAEHLGIAALVVVLSHFIGVWVSRTFG